MTSSARVAKYLALPTDTGEDAAMRPATERRAAERERHGTGRLSARGILIGSVIGALALALFTWGVWWLVIGRQPRRGDAPAAVVEPPR